MLSEEKRAANRSAFAMLVADLPAVMGEGWALTRYKNDTPWHAEITHATKGGVSLSLNEWEGRVSISGIFEDRVNGRQVWYKSSNESAPSITVAVTRSAKAVAAEIQRRVFPEYYPLLERCRQRVEEYKKICASANSVATALATYIGGQVNANTNGNADPIEQTVNVYRSTALAGSMFDLKVRGSSDGDAEVCFDRIRVPQHVARLILDVLVDHHINKEEE